MAWPSCLTSVIAQHNFFLGSQYDHKCRCHSDLRRTRLFSLEVGTEPRDLSIQTLHLEGNFGGFEDFILLPFLSTRSMELTDFRTADLSCFHNKTVKEVLEALGIINNSLRPDHFPRKDWSDDSEIAQVISNQMQLEELNIIGCAKAGTATMASTRDHFKHLEILHLPAHFSTSQIMTLSRYFARSRTSSISRSKAAMTLFAMIYQCFRSSNFTSTGVQFLWKHSVACSDCLMLTDSH